MNEKIVTEGDLDPKGKRLQVISPVKRFNKKIQEMFSHKTFFLPDVSGIENLNDLSKAGGA